MKIKRLIAVMVTGILLCTACGQKEENITNSTKEDVTAVASTDGSVDASEKIQEQEESVDELDKTEEEAIDDEIEYEEVIGDVDEVEYEEVFGDEDVDYGSITMDDIVSYEVGLDIPLMETDLTGKLQYLSKDEMGIDSLTVLFPSAYYITNQTPRATEVFDEESWTNFMVSVKADSHEFHDSNAFDKYEYGKYIVTVQNMDRGEGTEKERVNDMQYDIEIYNTELGTRILIQVAAHLEGEDAVQFMKDYEEAFVSHILTQVEAASK